MKIFNFNAYRISDFNRLCKIFSIIESFQCDIITVQEVNIVTALKLLRDKFHLVVNIEQNTVDNIGIITCVRKTIPYKFDHIIGSNGRIIGVRLGTTQIWNIYPKSGTNNKQSREIFFRQDLPNCMFLWRNVSDKMVIIGDYNCTHRLQDSLNYPNIHIQQGLIKFMDTYKLKDD